MKNYWAKPFIQWRNVEVKHIHSKASRKALGKKVRIYKLLRVDKNMVQLQHIVLLLMGCFIIAGFIFLLQGLPSYSIIMFGFAFLVVIFEYVIRPGNISKKWLIIIMIVIAILLISILNPQAVNIFIQKFMPNISWG